MKLSSRILGVCVLLCQASFAYEPDVTQQRMEYDEGPRVADHLIPTGSEIPVKAPRYYIAQFGVYPSFSGAFEWRVSLKDGKYILSSWRLERSKGDEAPHQVEVTESEISKDVAAVIYTLWANAILDARYTRHTPGLDGTTYAFSTYLRGVGWPSAKTWSPVADLPPKWLANAGEDVLAFARAKKSDSRELLARLQEIKFRLATYQTESRPNKSLQPTAAKDAAAAE